MAELAHVKGFPALDRVLQDFTPKMERNVLRGAVRAAARLIQKQAQANIHSVSGETARSVKVGSRVSGGDVVAYVRVKSYKGVWLEYGTRPHRIRAKNGEALAFGGRVVVAVDHPGARARAFLRPALDSQARAGVIAAGEYIKRRLATQHGIDTSDIAIEAEE